MKTAAQHQFAKTHGVGGFGGKYWKDSTGTKNLKYIKTSVIMNQENVSRIFKFKY